jgi:phage I-like protein
VVTVVASAATASEQTVIGSAVALELGKDNTPPEWIRLIPPGTFTLNDGRGPYHNRQPDQVIAETLTSLGGRDAGGDYDHATEYTEQTGQPAIASAWIKDWRVRDGAIEARTEWTERAARRIRAREYRYLSPVFDVRKSTGEVLRIKRFALTNKPSINDLPAIAASQAKKKENDLDLLTLIASALGMPGATADAVVVAVTNMKKNLDSVVASSGLKADASAETIIAALRDKPDAAKWIAATEYQRVTGELQTINAARDELQKKVARGEIESVIAQAMKDGKVVTSSKDYWTQVCASAGSAAPLVEFLKTAPVIVKPGQEPLPEGDPAKITAATLSQDQKDYCAAYGIDPEGFAKSLQTIVASSAT